MAYNFVEIMIIFMFTYYSIYIIKIIFSKKGRIKIQTINKQLDDYRSRPIKSIEEQKEFINIRRPKMIGTFKWSWKVVGSIILHMIMYIIGFRFYSTLIKLLPFTIMIWQAIIFIILFPLSFNILLRKFNIQRGDLSVFFRGGKKS